MYTYFRWSPCSASCCHIWETQVVDIRFTYELQEHESDRIVKYNGHVHEKLAGTLT